jgi:ATP-dependent Lhr-like helicase
VAVAGRRELEARILLAVGTDRHRAEQATLASDAFEDVHKILVFVNSRKQVDAGAGDFRSGRFSRCPVYGHHGSLSKAQREEAEARFKADSVAICVATMTLEVGIDIGDIDLVICMDPPFSLASFLQRIGRGCRRLNGRTRVLCVARDRAGELMFEALVRQAELGMPAGPTAPFRRSVLLQQVLAYLKQVPKHSRVAHQFVKVLATDAPPFVTERHVQDVLADMVQTGFLDKQRQVYQLASEGWGFIGSSAIYANIQANPPEVELVDVESGQVVATVAGIRGQSGGIRIAGRSYNFVPGGSPSTQLVRGGGVHQDSPKYHARSLPYAFDVGASLAGYFGIHGRELVAIRDGQGLVIMTWLGRLLNEVLADGFRRRGFGVVEGPFHLTVASGDDGRLLALLREIVQDVIGNNPLGTLKTERVADLGPHFRHLSTDQQCKAREDWLDQGFLRAWCEGLTEVRMVPTDSQIAADLLELT